ncbi:MAG: MFS transporter [Opitutaceae bacterium]|nr:MFS transporter [Opitutaceae bacterium]
MGTHQKNFGAGKPGAKVGIGIVFLTIFIDLVGFSIIFPLFPDMLDYYLRLEQESGNKGGLSQLIQILPEKTQHGLNLQTVLFGGILGSLYSLLQFVFSPIWGGLSDKLGRRRVLIYTVSATAIGYFVWIFSGNIWLLLLSRAIAGIASGNITVATAAVADLTSRENRAKGMALVGVAFGLGFTIGPAIGGISSTWSSGWESFGLNPFSFPAILSCMMAIINLILIHKFFKETLPETTNSPPPEKKRKLGRYPIFSIFRIEKNQILFLCLLYLIFFIAFSGMEFTLTFLAKERLKFGATFNGYMFIVIGVTMIIVQGGLVRKLAKPIGEKNLTFLGMICGIMAFLLLAYSPEIEIQEFVSGKFFTSRFFLGIICMSCAIGLISPCITSLVSLHSPVAQQGRNLGLLRSAGSLARVVGPILASSLYFLHSATPTYVAGAIVLIIPLLLTLLLKLPSQKN